MDFKKELRDWKRLMQSVPAAVVAFFTVSVILMNLLANKEIATGLSWLFYFKALQTGDVARVAPIDKLSVVITIGLALIFLKETVSARVIVGALFITAGSIMMLYK